MGGDGPAKKKKRGEAGETVEVKEEDEAKPALMDEEAKKAAQEFLETLKRNMDEKAKVDQADEVKLFESGWKERYYKSKFGVDILTEEGSKFPSKVVQSFMEGIC